jgi:hypothetical protein
MQSDTFDKVCAAIVAGHVHVSEQAYDKAVGAGLSIVDVIDATLSGQIVEDDPPDPRSDSWLAMITIGTDHAVWAFDESAGRAILIIVYHPDPACWSDDSVAGGTGHDG